MRFHLLKKHGLLAAASHPLRRCGRNHVRCPCPPIRSRSAIPANGMVVLERNSRANATFCGSPLRRILNPLPEAGHPEIYFIAAEAWVSSCGRKLGGDKRLDRLSGGRVRSLCFPKPDCP
jgi:hypothetical protein